MLRRHRIVKRRHWFYVPRFSFRYRGYSLMTFIKFTLLWRVSPSLPQTYSFAIFITHTCPWLVNTCRMHKIIADWSQTFAKHEQFTIVFTYRYTTHLRFCSSQTRRKDRNFSISCFLFVIIGGWLGRNRKVVSIFATVCDHNIGRPLRLLATELRPYGN